MNKTVSKVTISNTVFYDNFQIYGAAPVNDKWKLTNIIIIMIITTTTTTTMPNAIDLDSLSTNIRQ
jgi:hypothetical protein